MMTPPLATKFTIGFWGSIIMLTLSDGLWGVLWIILAFMYLFLDSRVKIAIGEKPHEREEEHKEEPKPTVSESETV